MRMVRKMGGMMELVRLARAVIELPLLDMKKAEPGGGGPKLAARLADDDELGGGLDVLAPSALVRW